MAYYILNFATMFTIQAAVTIVTAGLASQLFGAFGVENNLVLWATLLMFISLIILLIGKYRLLDNLMKYIIMILTVSTIIAVTVALFSSKEAFDVTQII